MLKHWKPCFKAILQALVMNFIKKKPWLALAKIFKIMFIVFGLYCYSQENSDTEINQLTPQPPSAYLEVPVDRAVRIMEKSGKSSVSQLWLSEEQLGLDNPWIECQCMCNVPNRQYSPCQPNSVQSLHCWRALPVGHMLEIDGWGCSTLTTKKYTGRWQQNSFCIPF